MGNVLDKAIKEDEAQLSIVPTPTGCAYCSEKVRLVSFKQLKPGDHIYQGGQSFTRTLFRNQKYLYTHHSIVKKVICAKETDHIAGLTLLHYSTAPYDAKLKIRETIDVRDLRLDEIYIVRYRYPRFQPNQVLDRAQKALKHDPEYSLLFLNCEHFCTWCVTGEQLSFQVEGAIGLFTNMIENLLRDFIATYIIHFVCNTGDNVAKVLEHCRMHYLLYYALYMKQKGFVFPYERIMVKIMKKKNISVKLIKQLLRQQKLRIMQGTTLIRGVSLNMYLIRNTVKHAILYNNFKKGQICKRCYSFEVKITRISLIVLYVQMIASILAEIFMTGSWPLDRILVPYYLLSPQILLKCSKVFQTTRSPFRGDKNRVQDMLDLQEGDVIQYRYWNMLHEAVISSVDYRNGCKIGKVHVVHYGLQSLVSKREIMEEELEIDLNEMEIFKLDYSRYTVYPPEEVVRRARQRVGERKFGVLTNRSCHVCHWAKVNESLDTISILDQGKYPSFELEDMSHQISTDQWANRPPSTSLIDKTWIKIKSEIRGGDPIQFSYHGHWHNGVCTEVHSTETARELTTKVVHYSYQGPFEIPEVKEEIFSFDLSVENVYIYHYHRAHRYSRAQIIDRARKKIGEKKYSMLHRNSGHLVEEIALKDKEEVINNPSELCEGDIVSFSCWGIHHKAVLVSIAKITSDMKCLMTVIHYATRGLFSTRTVVEENFSIDLAGDNLRKLNFFGYLTYPGHTVVERARKRLGEQKFNLMSNNLNHLVYWAKIKNQNKTFNQQTQIVSLNNIFGKDKRELHMEPVRSWEEFIPGHIVGYRYYCIWHQGILTEVNSREEKVKVVHYGTKHLLATRTILEEETKVNLKKENFYIYHPDPEYAYTPDEVIINEKNRLGEQKWGPGNWSFDFCRACVFRA